MAGDSTELATELARERAEVARLRSLLAVRDMELGDTRGRLLELETRARYALGIVRRLRALPRLAWQAAAGFRGSRD